MFVPFVYKSYKNSRLATVCSFIGSCLLAAAIITIVGMIQDGEGVVESILVGVVIAAIGLVFSFLAKGISSRKVKKQIKMQHENYQRQQMEELKKRQEMYQQKSTAPQNTYQQSNSAQKQNTTQQQSKKKNSSFSIKGILIPLVAFGVMYLIGRNSVNFNLNSIKSFFMSPSKTVSDTNTGNGASAARPGDGMGINGAVQNGSNSMQNDWIVTERFRLSGSDDTWTVIEEVKYGTNSHIVKELIFDRFINKNYYYVDTVDLASFRDFSGIYDSSAATRTTIVDVGEYYLLTSIFSNLTEENRCYELELCGLVSFEGGAKEDTMMDADSYMQSLVAAGAQRIDEASAQNLPYHDYFEAGVFG